MKSPLRYQITEFDCGSVSLINCIAYLFEREDIPAELVKAISSYTLDCYDEFGNLGQHGTSREAVRFLSRWIVDFSNSKDFKIKCHYLNGAHVNLQDITACLKNGGVVNLRTYLLDDEHYVSVTKIDEQYVYIFDPYYLINKEYKDSEVTLITNKPFNYNRKVSINRFLSDKKLDFALGPTKNREIVLFNKSA